MEQGFPADPPRGYLYGMAYHSPTSSWFTSPSRLAVVVAAAACEAEVMDCTYCSPYWLAGQAAMPHSILHCRMDRLLS